MACINKTTLEVPETGGTYGICVSAQIEDCGILTWVTDVQPSNGKITFIKRDGKVTAFKVESNVGNEEYYATIIVDATLEADGRCTGSSLRCERTVHVEGKQSTKREPTFTFELNDCSQKMEDRITINGNVIEGEWIETKKDDKITFNGEVIEEVDNIFFSVKRV